MSPRVLMSSSAVLMFAGGGIALFSPDLIADGMGDGASVAIQLFGGGLLGFAALNWLGRGAILGGVYGRPIVVGNFAFGVMTAGTLISAAIDGRLPAWSWFAASAFGIHALGFFWLMRRPPWDRERSLD